MLSYTPRFIVPFLASTIATTALSQPCQPTLINPIDVSPNHVTSVTTSGSLLYIATLNPSGPGGDLRIFDITNPESPLQLSTFNTNDGALAVTVSGQSAYLTTSAELFIIDVSTPTTPQLIGQLGGQQNAIDIAVSNNWAFITNIGSNGEFVTVDIANQSSPVAVASIPHDFGFHSAAIDGNHAYITSNQGGLHVFDVANPAAPALVAQRSPNSSGWHGLAVENSTLYLVEGASIVLLDITDPALPAELGQIGFDDPVEAIEVVGTTAFITGLSGVGPFTGPGLHVVDVADPQNPVLVGDVQFDSIGNAIAVHNNFAYIATGQELLQIIDISSCLLNDCPADTNGDGVLTPTDFTAWINAFNNNLPECDQNGDGACTPTDFTAWIANFNTGC